MVCAAFLDLSDVTTRFLLMVQICFVHHYYHAVGGHGAGRVSSAIHRRGDALEIYSIEVGEGNKCQEY